ncbi:IDEAL domain-containing protein [Paenibacillus jamilae]|nr:IDEAL domain-containing protein [Paenibacillus jamilae]
MRISMDLISSDYDLLIDQALFAGDKEWFEELVKKKI